MSKISMLDQGLSSMFQASSLQQLLALFDDELVSEILSCIYHASEPFLKIIERRLAVTVHKLANSNASGIHRERVEKILLQLRNRLDFVQQSSTKFSYFHHLLKISGSISIKQVQINNDPGNYYYDERRFQNIQTNFTYLEEKTKRYQPIDPSMDLLLNPNSYYSFSSCPNCIQEFYNDQLFDMSIMNRKYLSLYDGKMFQNVQEIKEEICAFANCGGGYIFIGINPQDHRVKGIRVSKESFKKFQQDIEKVKIFPEEKIVKVTAIPVFENSSSRKNSGWFVIRLFIKPQQSKETYYLIKQNTGFSTIHEIYMLNSSKQKVLLKERSIYEFMHEKNKTGKPYQTLPSQEKNKKGKLYKTLHYNQKCKQTSEGQWAQQLPNSELNQVQQQADQINFKYKFQSIVRLANTKAQYINKLQKAMNVNNFAFQKEQVFPSLQKEAPFVIWMICHEIKVEEIKNLLEQKEKQAIKFYPINLKIRLTDAMPKKVFNAFESTFEKNFNSKIEKVNWTKEKDQKYFHLEMKFSNKQQSTFAFIKLEKQQLRPEFVSY